MKPEKLYTKAKKQPHLNKYTHQDNVSSESNKETVPRQNLNQTNHISHST